MSPKTRAVQFLVCDDNNHTRRLVADVLAGSGFERIKYAKDGVELLKLTTDVQPRVVITSSRVPGLSGLEYTRKIRAGHDAVNRATSIIVMTDTPTQKFLDAARASGVDEMLVRPFTGAALLTRVEAVLVRPRRFVESVNYVGPCRRRRMLDEYGGPLRRFTDPVEASGLQPWEVDANRELTRRCVARIGERAAEVAAGERHKLKDLFESVRDTEQLAEDVLDQTLADAARSLGRYITGVGKSGTVDAEVLRTHIDAMQTLGMLGSDLAAARTDLVAGLVKVVDKRLGLKSGAPSRAA